jgi:hypothetical protein
MTPRSSAATVPVQGPVQNKKDLILVVDTAVFFDDIGFVFQVSRRLQPSDQRARDSILTLDYKYTPWPRCGGNLLWS